MKKISVVLIVMVMVFGAVTSFADVNGPYRNGFIDGYVKARGDQEITIEEYDGTVHTLPLLQDVDLRIDGIPVPLNEFKVGMEVYGELRGRSISYLESYATENPGYIPPGSKMRSGIVKTIDRNQLVIVSPIGQEERYFTSPSTLVLKKGRNTPLSTLYEGDRVKLYFDDIRTDMISRMELEGDSILIKDLYRGHLSIVDNFDDSVVIEDVEVFENNQWEDVKEHIQFPFNGDMPLYWGGRKILAKDLKYYRGNTVYLAIKDYFGKDKIEKMVVKSRYENLLSDKITGINWYADTFEMKNNKNITFHEGTIIIKNGRLVDKEAINVNSDALVVADGVGTSLTADVISIYNEEINNSNVGQNYLYTGRLNTIFQDRIYLKDYFLLDHNEWQSHRTYSERDEKELYYDNDTKIYDIEDEKMIPPEAFYAKNYGVDEDSDYTEDNDHKDWYGYVFTDGNRIAGITVQEDLDSLLAQRITTGHIETIAEDSMVGWTMTIRNGKDWSSKNEKWMPKITSIRVNIEKALIIKEGEMIQPQDLRPGDRLYMVRDDFYGKAVIVK